MAPKVVIQLVEELKDVMPIGEICRHLGVGRSSYYRWKKNADQLTQKKIETSRLATCVNNINSDMVIERLPPYTREFVRKLCSVSCKNMVGNVGDFNHLY